MKHIIFIMGPTASGKTDLVLSLADRLPIDIISVDSALVYQEMNIGTAKPNSKILNKYPHYLVDIIPPNAEYNVRRFCIDALAYIQHSHNNNRTPVLVGGTSFYFHALEYGLSHMPQSTPESRLWVNTLIDTQGLTYAYEKLMISDPLSAQKIHSNDRQRIARALEVFYLTQTPLSSLQGNKESLLLGYKLHKYALLPETQDLNERISLRFKQMIREGFVAEVEYITQKYQLQSHHLCLKCVGYRQLYQHIKGELSLAYAIERGVIATRQLAKKQRTWLRSMPEVKTLRPPYSVDDVRLW